MDNEDIPVWDLASDEAGSEELVADDESIDMDVSVPEANATSVADPALNASSLNEGNDHEEDDASSVISIESGRPPPGSDPNVSDSDAEEEFKIQRNCPSSNFLKSWQDLHEKSYDRKREIYYLEEDKKGLLHEIKNRDHKIAQLKEEIEKLKGRGRQRHTATWPDRIKKQKVVPEDWMKVYKLACCEGNSSPNLRNLHPYLKLRAPTADETQHQPDPLTSEPGFDLPNHNSQEQVSAPCPAVGLPASLQFEILKHCLIFGGEIVHAISRLDPYYPLDEVPRDVSGNESLFHRFHVGKAKVSIAYGTNPQAILASLLVCKTWNFWGSHLFYGENKFAFSSLGE